MDYESFLQLMKYRRSIRTYKPDPIPDDYITKILDASRYAMSGANSQPWEFIVVKDPEIKRKLFHAYVTIDGERTYYLEQQRIQEYRHPAFNAPDDAKDKVMAMMKGWEDAPVYLAVILDPRKQLGSVIAARADLKHDSVLAVTMGHLSMTIQLAAASLGLGSQRIDVISQQPYREILGYPEPLRLDIIAPLGYRAYEPGPPHRLPLEDLVYFDRYDMGRYIEDKDFLRYLKKIRTVAKPGYSLGERKGEE